MTKQKTETYSRLVNQIGKYPSKNSNVRAYEYLTIDEKDSLYEKKGEKQNPKLNRVNFIRYIKNRLKNITICNANDKKNHPENAVISLQSLLGKEGVKLYQLALAEEMNSKEYRNAVLDHSTDVIENAQGQWNKKPIIYIGGPSASGKSYAADSIIKEVTELLRQDKEGSVKQSNSRSDKPFITRIDGGVCRELSQMRKLVIRLANMKGYSGVRDLHNQSKILDKMKPPLLQAIRKNPKFGILIPETFSYWVPVFNRYKDPIEDFCKDDKAQTFFCRVVGEDEKTFQNTVKFMGSRRAWKTDWESQEKNRLDLNDTKGLAESKAYGASGFWWGKNGSDSAREYYDETQKSLNKPILTIDITNDLILLKENKQGMFESAKPDDKNIFMVSNSIYKKWLSKEHKKIPLKEFAKNNSSKPTLKMSGHIEALKKKAIIRVNLNEPDNKRAWDNAILPLLIKYKIKKYKVARDDSGVSIIASANEGEEPRQCFARFQKFNDELNEALSFIGAKPVGLKDGNKPLGYYTSCPDDSGVFYSSNSIKNHRKANAGFTNFMLTINLKKIIGDFEKKLNFGLNQNSRFYEPIKALINDITEAKDLKALKERLENLHYFCRINKDKSYAIHNYFKKNITSVMKIHKKIVEDNSNDISTIINDLNSEHQPNEAWSEGLFSNAVYYVNNKPMQSSGIIDEIKAYMEKNGLTNKTMQDHLIEKLNINTFRSLDLNIINKFMENEKYILNSPKIRINYQISEQGKVGVSVDFFHKLRSFDGEETIQPIHIKLDIELDYENNNINSNSMIIRVNHKSLEKINDAGVSKQLLNAVKSGLNPKLNHSSTKSFQQEAKQKLQNSRDHQTTNKQETSNSNKP